MLIGNNIFDQHAKVVRMLEDITHENILFIPTATENAVIKFTQLWIYSIDADNYPELMVKIFELIVKTKNHNLPSNQESLKHWRELANEYERI